MKRTHPSRHKRPEPGRDQPLLRFRGWVATYDLRARRIAAPGAVLPAGAEIVGFLLLWEAGLLN
jgi:hypothetical protein